jgi:hypothetical protein
VRLLTLKFEIVDYSSIGEMLQKAVIEANQFFSQHAMPQRFKLDMPEVNKCYEIFMSKKSGKPKTDYPGKLRDNCRL